MKVRREGSRMFYAAHNAHVGYLVEQALFHADHLASGLADHQGDTAGGAPARATRRA